MSTIAVMDKSTKSSCRVKYSTEKDRPGGAGLKLMASHGTWVSEIRNPGTWVSEILKSWVSEILGV